MKFTMLSHVVLAIGLCGAGMAVAQSDFADASGMTYEEKLEACAACHGEHGDKPLAPDYPVLAGQYADYLEQALLAYRTGRRQHPIMNMQVEALGLTREDMHRMARYFSHQPGLVNLELE